MRRLKDRLSDVSRREYLKTLGGAGVILGGIGTGITAADADHQKKCPKGLDITYTRKHGKWSPDTGNNTGNGVDPDEFRVGGTKKKVWVCARFPFAVTYAIRKKRDDKEKHKKKNHEHDEGDESSHEKNSCKKQETVRAEEVDGYYRVAIKLSDHRKKRKKKEICCVHVHCPKHHKDRKNDDHEKNGRDDDHEKNGRDDDHEKNGRDDDHEKNGRDDDHEKNGRDDDHEKNGRDDDHEKNGRDDDHEKNGRDDDHEKNGKKDCKKDHEKNKKDC